VHAESSPNESLDNMADAAFLRDFLIDFVSKQGGNNLVAEEAVRKLY
jgi:hypothetical protein